MSSVARPISRISTACSIFGWSDQKKRSKEADSIMAPTIFNDGGRSA